MELASMLADEPFTDRPGTTSAVIAALLRTYNDGLGDDRRQDLYPLASVIVGTAASRRVERDRASRCLEFARSLGAAAPAGRAAIGVASPEASGSWAALAALRTGPTDGVHARTLAFTRELAAMGSRRGHRLWPDWVSGPDPGRAVEEALAKGPPAQFLEPCRVVVSQHEPTPVPRPVRPEQEPEKEEQRNQEPQPRRPVVPDGACYHHGAN